MDLSALMWDEWLGVIAAVVLIGLAMLVVAIHGIWTRTAVVAPDGEDTAPKVVDESPQD